MSTYFSAGFIKILHDFNVCYLLSETYFTHVAVNYSFTMFDFQISRIWDNMSKIHEAISTGWNTSGPYL